MCLHSIHRSRLLGACTTIFKGSDADSGNSMRAGVAIIGQLYGIERAASEKAR
jgi:hypothetical protein